VIESESGLSVKQFWCQPAVLDELRQRIDQLYPEHEPIVRQYPPAADESNQPAHEPQDAVAANGVPEHSIPDAEISSPLTESGAASDGQVHVGGLSPGGERYGIPALIVRGTCRAGEVLRVTGNVVVLGNVNPGAQIIAEGDILVFGSLRGMAHAGAAGDSTATIIAMSTGNPDLRIAEYVYSTDDLTGDSRGAQNNDRRAVIARVQNRSLRVSAYLKNHSIDHGGNPNER
jgi:septum formation inhibitor MinC